jgi:hypothetical protein
MNNFIEEKNDFIDHIKTNSYPNSIEEKNKNFSLEDQKTKLELINNNNKVFSIKIDRFYKPLIAPNQKKCDFLVYKTGQTATFIELKGGHLDLTKAYEQLKNTILHFKTILGHEKIFAVIGKLCEPGNRNNKNSLNFIKATKANLFEINVKNKKYNLDTNQLENYAKN